MYRLGLDLGTNSIGWAVLDLDETGTPCSVRAMGSRIFPDGRNPKDGTSNAVARRMARQPRRRRDRFLQRQRKLMRLLMHYGLMPEGEAERKALQLLDPYMLRSRGLTKPLSLHELGRAIFHLNQRRGFKSNRKTDRGNKDKGEMHAAMTRLQDLLQREGCETLGDWLWKRHAVQLPVRVRPFRKPSPKDPSKLSNTLAWEYYPRRDMLEMEFDLLWQRQMAHHPHLTAAIGEEIAGAIFFQRPLKPVAPGYCLFELKEERAPQAMPLVQEFRILQEVSNIRVIERDLSQRPLEQEEREMVAGALLQGDDVTFAKIRKLLGLPMGVAFSLEDEKRDRLKGDAVAKVMKNKAAFGSQWKTLSRDDQTDVILLLQGNDDDAATVSELVTRWGLSQERALAVLDSALPEGYSRLSLKALARIVPRMREEHMDYAEACQAVEYHHSDFRDTNGVIDEKLPYYGKVLSRYVMPVQADSACAEEKQYGRIGNPTVHIVLNQLRKLVNKLIKRYGHPASIIVELGRDLKNSREERERIKKEQSKRQKDNEILDAQIQQQGLLCTYDNRLRLRLHAEQGGKCLYTGAAISMAMLFSDEVEVDHILPFSRTYDDGVSNKVLCLRAANRVKKQQTPFEAFSSSPSGYPWDEILARAGDLPGNKKWRFGEDAMERYKEEFDFFPRQLNDTRYVSKLARLYLCRVCDPKKVHVTSGALTGMLRKQLVHEPKDRNDHRHHAVDAAIIAITDTRMVQQVARLSTRKEQGELDRWLRELQPPWPTFHQDILAARERIIVSHKPDHNLAGPLHEMTCFNIVYMDKDAFSRPNSHVVVSQAIQIDQLKKDDVLSIRDKWTRDALMQLSHVTSNDDWKAAIGAWGKKNSVQRVTIVRLLGNPSTYFPVKHGTTGGYYKVYEGGENAYIEIFMMENGAWGHDVVSRFNAVDPNYVTMRQKQSRPLVMRLFKNDMIALQENGERQIYVIDSIAAAGQLHLSLHNDCSGKLFSPRIVGLQKRGARKVHVSILGKIMDPGPRR